MDNVPALIGLLLYWRMLLAIALALAIGTVVAPALPSVGPPVILGTCILGIAFGVGWQARAEDTVPATAVREAAVSKPVALLGMAFLGALWGALTITAIGSVLFSFIAIAIAPFLVGPLIGAILKRRFTANQLLFAACGLALGFVAPLSMYVSKPF